MVSEWSLNPNDNWNDDPGNGFDDSGFGNHCNSDGDIRFWFLDGVLVNSYDVDHNVDGVKRYPDGVSRNAYGVQVIAYGVSLNVDGFLSNVNDDG